jgi:hypothetical protein
VTTPPSAVDPLWNTNKIAEYFGVEPSTVLRWITDKPDKPELRLEGRKINNRWKVLQSEVYRFRDIKFAQGDNR